MTPPWQLLFQSVFTVESVWWAPASEGTRLRRRRRCPKAAAPPVACKTSRGDVAGLVAAALATGRQMLGGASTQLCLPHRQSVDRCEGAAILLPHRQSAIATTTALPMKSVNAGTRERFSIHGSPECQPIGKLLPDRPVWVIQAPGGDTPSGQRHRPHLRYGSMKLYLSSQAPSNRPRI